MNIQNREQLTKAKPPPPPQNLAERLHRMLRHKYLIGVAIVLLTAGLVAAVLYIQARPAYLTIAVGPRAGEDQRLAQALSQHLSRERAKIRLRVIRKDAGSESSEALEKGEVDLAVVRRDLGMPKNGQVIAIHRRNVAVLVVPPQAPAQAAAAKRAGKGKAAAKKAAKKATKPIEKIEDLAGKTVVIVGRTPANANLLNTVLAQYGVAPDKVNKVQISTDDLTTQLKTLPYDALLAIGPVGSKITSEAIAAAATRGKEAPKFLEVGSSEAIEQQNPVYESTEIPGGAFGVSRPAETVETIGVSHYIVAHRNLDEKLAGDFTRLLFSAKQALGSDQPSFAKIESPDTDKAANLAVHPGALAYLEGEQKTFFERYSEPLYWGLMLLSFFGSGAAWLASYTKSDSNGEAQDLEAMIGLVPRARTAVSANELDLICAEIDAIMERTIRHIEAGKLEGNSSSAMRLAADHARNAISERRATLKA
jgi:TRAP-type uncharacterized transport system substrate-binding protein